MADFPTDLSALTDNVDDVMAKHVNNLEEKVGTDSSAVTSTHDFKLAKHACCVYNSADHTLGNASATDLTWDTEEYDIGGLHEGVTNPSRITIVKSGVYQVSAQVGFDANATGSRRIYLKVDAATIAEFGDARPSSGQKCYPCIQRILNLSAGNYVEVAAFQDSGGDLNDTNGFRYTYLAVALIHAT